jgi:hypothetical protein
LTPSSQAKVPARRVCRPGETQRCVGSGACEGGQACSAEGTGFGPCDCGNKGQTYSPLLDAGIE